MDGGGRYVGPRLHHPAGGLRTCPRESRWAVVGPVRRAPWKRSLSSLESASNMSDQRKGAMSQAKPGPEGRACH
eukprot:8567153-Pyramimonas_sp.AAC.1